MGNTLDNTFRELYNDDNFYIYSFLGMNMNRREDPNQKEGVKVYFQKGKNKNQTCSVNPEIFDSQTSDQRKAALAHEFTHLALNHPTSYGGKAYNNKSINAAMDVVVNNILEKASSKNEFPGMLKRTDLNNVPGISNVGNVTDTLAYYDLFKNNENRLPDSCSGEAHSWMREAPEGEEKEDMTDDQLDLYVKTLTESLVAQSIEQARRSRGTLPGFMQEIMDDMENIDAPILNWKTALQRFVQSEVENYRKISRRKMNRRVEEWMGRKKYQKVKVHLYFDTSGSIGQEEYREYESQMAHMFKSLPIRIIVKEFDTAIASTYEFEGQFTTNIHGRGGTDFECVLDDMRENKIHSSIIFTDGYAPIPGNYKNEKLLWIITSNGAKSEFPGLVVQIPSTN